jgi:hypothetical protein
MALKSRLLGAEPALEAALESDPAHIARGARGRHVRKVQEALILLDQAKIDADGVFGDATAKAVLSYKRKREIINRSYQETADDIVGRMTMASLDRELVEKEGEPQVLFIPDMLWRPLPPRKA